jgi:hypothetical protein
MPEVARPAVMIVDFPGFFTNVDPRDLPQGGAEEQVNATSVVIGELRVRFGIREVEFED